MVLNCLDPDQLGPVMQHLDEEMRGSVFLMMREPPKAPAAMLEKIVATTVEKGARLDANSVADPAAEAIRKMTEVLRSVDRDVRGAMLTALEEEDPDMFDDVKKRLYVFEDILGVTDRSIQKLLGEVDSNSLSLAIKDADPEIVDKITNNLSKRARATLLEELEFLGSIKPAEQEAAQQVVCSVMAKLDESGDLELEAG